MKRPYMLSRACAALLLANSLIISGLCADPPAFETVFIARATAEHPRHSEAAIVELADGTLYVVWQEYRAGGTGDSDFSPNCLAAMRSRDGGRTWGQRQTVVETPGGDTNVYSPSLLRLPSGEVLLTFMRYHGFDRAGDRRYPPTTAACWVSDDEARTWRPRGELWHERPITFASSTLKRLASGRLVLAVNLDSGNKTDGDHWQAGACVSDDGGSTWRLCETWSDAPRRGAMEPQIEELKDGRLFMVIRTQMGSIYRSYSSDAGYTWTPAESLGIKAPESCPGLARIPKTGELLLLWNDSYDPNHYSHGGKRTPLVAATSSDEGQSWSKPRAIEADPDYAFTNPGIAFTRDGHTLINYWTSKYRPNGAMGDDRIDLKLAIIPPEWLIASGE